MFKIIATLLKIWMIMFIIGLLIILILLILFKINVGISFTDYLINGGI